ncbi:ATP-binding cassette domain-containing protein [Streptomyces sp. M10(2022)]
MYADLPYTGHLPEWGGPEAGGALARSSMCGLAFQDLLVTHRTTVRHALTLDDAQWAAKRSAVLCHGSQLARWPPTTAASSPAPAPARGNDLVPRSAGHRAGGPGSREGPGMLTAGTASPAPSSSPPGAWSGIPQRPCRGQHRPQPARGRTPRLLGPNGAGKTTTLLMCLGAVEPDAGSVEILGHRLPRRRAEAMQGVGFVAGYLPLPDRIRVREYLRLYADLYGLRDPAPPSKQPSPVSASSTWRWPSVPNSPAARGLWWASPKPHCTAPPDDPRRAHRLPGPGHRPACTYRTARPLRGAGHRPPGHQPRHGRGGAAVRTRRLPAQWAHRRRRNPGKVAEHFGRQDLEGVFLHLAEERDRERAAAS